MFLSEDDLSVENVHNLKTFLKQFYPLILYHLNETICQQIYNNSNIIIVGIILNSNNNNTYKTITTTIIIIIIQ